MKLYKSRTGYCNSIELVEVDRMTDKSVWIEGLCLRRVTEWEVYHTTFEEAKDRLRVYWERKIGGGEKILADQRESLRKVLEMTEVTNEEE